MVLAITDLEKCAKTLSGKEFTKHFLSKLDTVDDADLHTHLSQLTPSIWDALIRNNALEILALHREKVADYLLTSPVLFRFINESVLLYRVAKKYKSSYEIIIRNPFLLGTLSASFAILLERTYPDLAPTAQQNYPPHLKEATQLLRDCLTKVDKEFDTQTVWEPEEVFFTCDRIRVKLFREENPNLKNVYINRDEAKILYETIIAHKAMPQYSEIVKNLLQDSSIQHFLSSADETNSAYQMIALSNEEVATYILQGNFPVDSKGIWNIIDIFPSTFQLVIQRESLLNTLSINAFSDLRKKYPTNTEAPYSGDQRAALLLYEELHDILYTNNLNEENVETFKKNLLILLKNPFFNIKEFCDSHLKKVPSILLEVILENDEIFKQFYAVGFNFIWDLYNRVEKEKSVPLLKKIITHGRLPINDGSRIHDIYLNIVMSIDITLWKKVLAEPEIRKKLPPSYTYLLVQKYPQEMSFAASCLYFIKNLCRHFKIFVHDGSSDTNKKFYYKRLLPYYPADNPWHAALMFQIVLLDTNEKNIEAYLGLPYEDKKQNLLRRLQELLENKTLLTFLSLSRIESILKNMMIDTTESQNIMLSIFEKPENAPDVTIDELKLISTELRRRFLECSSIPQKVYLFLCFIETVDPKKIKWRLMKGHIFSDTLMTICNEPTFTNHEALYLHLVKKHELLLGFRDSRYKNVTLEILVQFAQAISKKFTMAWKQDTSHTQDYEDAMYIIVETFISIIAFSNYNLSRCFTELFNRIKNPEPLMANKKIPSWLFSEYEASSFYLIFREHSLLRHFTTTRIHFQKNEYQDELALFKKIVDTIHSHRADSVFISREHLEYNEKRPKGKWEALSKEELTDYAKGKLPPPSRNESFWDDVIKPSPPSRDPSLLPSPL